MRISDWSSDVCSSDLDPYRRLAVGNVDVERHFADHPQAHVLQHRQDVRERHRAVEHIDLEPQLIRRRACRAVEIHREVVGGDCRFDVVRSEEHTSELQSLMRISYAVFCLKKKKIPIRPHSMDTSMECNEYT